MLYQYLTTATPIDIIIGRLWLIQKTTSKEKDLYALVVTKMCLIKNNCFNHYAVELFRPDSVSNLLMLISLLVKVYN